MHQAPCAPLACNRQTCGLNVPQIGPLAAAEGLDLQGSTSLHLTASRQSTTTHLALDATVSLTGGTTPGPALIGTSARIAVVANLAGNSLDLARLSVDGQDLSVAASGAVSPQKVDLAWSAALPHIAAVDPRLAGTLGLTGQFTGSEQNLALAADLAGEVGLPGQASGPFTAHLQAEGLPRAPQATVSAQGALLGSPLQLRRSRGRDSRTARRQTDTCQATWKSASIQGALTLPARATLPVGNLPLPLQNLSDFAPLVGRAVTGSAHLMSRATTAEAVLAATLHDVGVSGTGSIAEATANATIANPASHPSVDGRVVVTGLLARSLTDFDEFVAKGPADALVTQLGAPHRCPGLMVRRPGAWRAPRQWTFRAKTVTLSALNADWRQQNLRLLAPARIAFVNGVDINNLRLGLANALIEVNGRIGSTLDLTANARDLPVSLAKSRRPLLAATGTLSAAARAPARRRLPPERSAPAAPACDLRTRPAAACRGPASPRPPTLQGTAARVDATVTAGPSHLTITGEAPFTTTAAQPEDPGHHQPGDGGSAAGAARRRHGRNGHADCRHHRHGGAPRRHGPRASLRRPHADPVRSRAAAGRGHGNRHAERDDGTDRRAGHGRGVELALNGTAPAHALLRLLDLHTTGTINLALANPLLEANGERVTGIVERGARRRRDRGGTAPDRRCPAQRRRRAGLRAGGASSAITARLVAAGDTLRLASLTARAGEGTIERQRHDRRVPARHADQPRN